MTNMVIKYGCHKIKIAMFTISWIFFIVLIQFIHSNNYHVVKDKLKGCLLKMEFDKFELLGIMMFINILIWLLAYVSEVIKVFSDIL